MDTGFYTAPTLQLHNLVCIQRCAHLYMEQGNRSLSRPGGDGGDVILRANPKLTCVGHIASGYVSTKLGIF